ncbi:MAG: IS1595 family transposase [Methylocella sp.]
MSRSVVDAKALHDEATAYAWVEARRWPDGPSCPHCGGFDRISKMQGKSTRVGVYKCYQCRKPFTVKVGTVFEDSHVPMRHWLQAIYLMRSSKKGVSSNQLHRTLGVTLKTAWFMAHRLREAMRRGSRAPMGGSGSTVEADETFIGRKDGSLKRRGHGRKNAVLSLVDRESGPVRSFHVDGTSATGIMPIIKANAAKETAMMTGEGGHYFTLGDHFASQESVSHKADEYVRGDVRANTVEGCYSIFKRGMKGVRQHCGERHLPRYLAEFDFRYSNRVKCGIDAVRRSELALKGIAGKRLAYRTAHQQGGTGMGIL